MSKLIATGLLLLILLLEGCTSKQMQGTKPTGPGGTQPTSRLEGTRPTSVQ